MATDRPAESERAAQTGTRSATITRAAWIAILSLTGAFHLFRGAPVDGLIFFAGALGLALDAFGWLRIRPLDRERTARRLLSWILMAVLLLVLALAPLYGGVESVVVVAIGVALIPVVWPQPAVPTPRARPDAVRRAAFAWSVIAVVGCAWEIGAYFMSRPSPAAEFAFPPLSDLVDPFIASPIARAVLIAIWLVGGYALIRRGRSR
ncbi:hypothetical protein G3T36_11675 [Diaminobutyricibacter tongyongensis]|uniref:Uncharacterized protein n=1 Tax=Leifsonia tongyongensis TaxID=1268043 RepID=A0A6L9XZU2_9MICO|nr:hypothetical protein [Diaminobutyricibacter tongyongensis]NEN06528.1 hypothetical protein [Diaminobutyricibacter tongyongensis]